MTHLTNKTRLYEALGQIVVSFNLLEQKLDCLLLSSLARVDAQNAVVLKGMSFAQKVTVMNDLIRELHMDINLGPLHHTLVALVERCHNCERERNNWIRAYWVPEVASKAGQVMSLQSSANIGGLELKPVNISELEHFVVLLNATAAYLSGFHQKLFVNFGKINSNSQQDTIN
jgi:hypothetical protein